MFHKTNDLYGAYGSPFTIRLMFHKKFLIAIPTALFNEIHNYFSFVRISL